MEKRLSFIYTVLSIVFFVLILLFSFLRIYSIRQENISVAEKSISLLQRSLNSAARSESGFNSAAFRRISRDFLRSSPAARIVVVFSYDTGVQYMISRAPGYLAEDPASDIRVSEPRFHFNTLSEALVSTPLMLSDEKGVVLEGIFTVLDGSSFYPVIRDTLIGSGAFLLLTLLLILVLSILRSSEAEAETESNPEAFEPEYEGVPPAAAESVETEFSHPPSPRNDIDLHFHEHMPEYRPEETTEEFMIDENDLDFSLEDLEQLEPETEHEAAPANEGTADLYSALRAALAESPDFTLMIGTAAEHEELPENLVSFVRETLPEGTGVYASGGKFAVILFDTPFEESVSTADALIHEYERTSGIALLIGLSPVSRREISSARLIKEAERALSRAADRPGERVIGFKPDPNRFREMNSSSDR